MIESVIIKDNKNTPVTHTYEVFKNGQEFKFKKGINIIVGPNGSGKSTLLTLIARYALCDKVNVTRMNPNNLTEILDHLDHVLDDEINDGVLVKHDYNGVVYNLPCTWDTGRDSSRITESFENFGNHYLKTHSSEGEKVVIGMKALFKVMFDKDANRQFPIEQIKELAERLGTDNKWGRVLSKLLKYYKDNQIKITKEDFEFTVLMDEPDKNLDIYNIDEIYSVLSTRKPLTQLIAVVHNPFLIYKLAQLNHINFIEMKEGYKDEVINKIRYIIER